jgi:hypothetical protein
MTINYHHPRPARGQQRDKLYREALRLELAAAGEHSGPDSEPIRRVVREIVHVNVSPEELSALNEAEKLRANGSGQSGAASVGIPGGLRSC